MLADAASGGVQVSDWESAQSWFDAAWESVDGRRRAGELGFFELPERTALLDQTLNFVEQVRGRYKDIVLLGIGGSALGPVALRNALRPPHWNTLDDAARDGFPRLHVLDNVDPVTVGAVLDRVQFNDTLFLVVSKSGGTAETMSQYLIVRGMLIEQGLPLAEHLVFVTDPEKGALRPIAEKEGIPALDIPPDVGGRFSVLTPVGLLPAALIGIDVRALLRGAGLMESRCRTKVVTENPAAAYALLQYMADTTRGRRVHVLMPYSDALRDIAGWFVQLWAESLGKVTPSGDHVGPTPVPAVGATDQHSQVQLFMEGPHDKTVTFVAVRKGGRDLTIPALHSDVADLSYLGGRTLGELLDTERRATAGALASRGRPSVTLEMERVDASELGELLMLFSIATAYAGALYGVNAFDQPGVEQGKLFTYGIMGRPGFDKAGAEFRALPQPSPVRRV